MCLHGRDFFFGAEGCVFHLGATRVVFFLSRVVRAIVSVKRSGREFHEFDSMYGEMIKDSDETLIRYILVSMLRRL